MTAEASLDYDTVILGLGGVGSFALRAVAKKGSKALGIERFTRCHSKGSSHGHSRVYRMAYFEHPSYVPWVQYSVEEFRKLQERHQTQMINECGVLVAVSKGDRKWADACLASAQLHNIPTETSNANQLQERFPQFRYQKQSGDIGEEFDMIGVFEPGGGMVRPERVIHAALKEAENDFGATIWEDATVKSVKEVCDDHGVILAELVVEQSGKFVAVTARNVLVAAGAWTSELIPSWKPHLKPVRIIQTWVDVSQTTTPRIYDTPNMPCIVMVKPSLPIPVYCLPADSSSNSDPDEDQVDNHSRYKNCVKLGVHGGDPVDPDGNSSQSLSKEEEEKMIQNIQETFCDEIAAIAGNASPTEPFSQSTLDTSSIESKPCMYTMTKDDHFMIGVPKGMTIVCAVAGLSGHGFKMTPALGQMMADFALASSDDERRAVFDEKWKASFCAPTRFGV